MYRRPRICFYVITQIQCCTLTSVYTLDDVLQLYKDINLPKDSL